MRYYKIVVTNPSTGQIMRQWSSLDAKGNFLPGALNIELDIPVTVSALPMGGSYVRIWGVPLQDLGGAANFNGKNIAVYAGMSKGLPLANPKQAGLIVQGSIQQAFGNWVNTDMTLDFILLAAPGQPVNKQSPIDPLDAPVNLALNWPANTPLAQPLQNALQTAFPGYVVSVSVSANLVRPYASWGYYQTLGEFAAWLKPFTQAILGGSYQGVDITVPGGTIIASDGTVPVGNNSTRNPKQIAFTDLIGQPTWIEPLTIQAKCVMRADIAPQDFVKLPPSLATTTPQALSQYRQSSVFQGVFQAKVIRHVGNFRQPDASSWVTIIDSYQAA